MPGGLPGIVEAVLRKFHAEAMERALVHARDESFHGLCGEELEAT